MAAPEPQLMTVKTDLVKDLLVGQIHAIVTERHDRALPIETELALERAVSGTLGNLEHRLGSDLATGLARAGYLARAAETELFEPARKPADTLAELLRPIGGRPPDVSDVAAEIARREPVERPDPGDERATTWRIPGPGGHVRHYAALAAIEWLGTQRRGGRRDEPDAGALKRSWLCGFFVRCCEENVPDRFESTS